MTGSNAFEDLSDLRIEGRSVEDLLDWLSIVLTKAEFRDLSAGWATNVVVDLVTDLHKQLGEDPPKYLESV